MLSLKNPLVYLMFHPLAYTVKLKIEMSMAELIAHVSRAQEPGPVKYNGEGSSGYRSENGTITKGFNSTTVFSPTRTTASKRDSTHMPASQSPHPDRDLEMGKMRPQSPESMPSSHFGIIPEEASQHEDVIEAQHGFIVHRHHEVTMEVESVPSERSDKHTESEDYDTRRRTQDSDEQPLRKDGNPMGLATKVWGRY